MRLSLPTLLIAAALSCDAQPGGREEVLRKAMDAEHSFDSRTALTLYLDANRIQPGDPVVLQKIARQYSDLAEYCRDPEEKRRMLETALGYAQGAVRLEPRNAVNVLSLAICHGKLAACSDVRQKIAYSRMVRDEAEQALALDPGYSWAHHVLGCWHYEVASLNAADRFVARLLYGGLPPASFTEAIQLLKRSVDLDPADPAHHIELGFAYRAAGLEKEARLEFTKGLGMPCIENFDKEAQGRARRALASN
jgi:tetratricopeptide (TPR) repeat protein